MHLTPYQIAAPVIAVIAMLYAWNLVLRNKKSILEALLWTLFWGAVALVALAPWLLHYLSVVTGIANQENAVIVTFMGILFFMVFYLVMRIEELEQRHAKVVRAVALREAGLDGGRPFDSAQGREGKEREEGKEGH